MFDKLGKESGDYLQQIKNNIPEKTGLIEQAINKKKLPKTQDGIIRIIELGIGGGESLKHFKKITLDSEEVELLAVDILPDLGGSLKKETGIEAVAADAGSLPFPSESVSAINASAILHEVSSYGAGVYKEKNKRIDTLYDKEAVVKAFREFHRVLLPKGQLAYRDLLAPVEDLATPKKVEYFNKSWQFFIKWFTKDFVNSNSNFIESIPITINASENGCTINASVKFHRELQRHYLMFRDYLRNVKQKDIGLRIVKSDWLDKKKGLKVFTFSLNKQLTSSVDISDFETHNSNNGKIYKGDSDQFDFIYDKIIEHYFTQLETDPIKGKSFSDIIETWKAREGSEHYIYGNIADILMFSCESSFNTNSSYVLFPESSADINILKRFYYNRYLKQVIDMPEEDGKQIIAFKKIPKTEAKYHMIDLMASSIGREIFNEEISKKISRLLE